MEKTDERHCVQIQRLVWHVHRRRFRKNEQMLKKGVTND